MIFSILCFAAAMIAENANEMVGDKNLRVLGVLSAESLDIASPIPCQTVREWWTVDIVSVTAETLTVRFLGEFELYSPRYECNATLPGGELVAGVSSVSATNVLTCAFAWSMSSYSAGQPVSFEVAHPRHIVLFAGVGSPSVTLLPRSCRDLLDTGIVTNGEYTIYATGDPAQSRSVVCDMTTGTGGWTLWASSWNSAFDMASVDAVIATRGRQSCGAAGYAPWELPYNEVRFECASAAHVVDRSRTVSSQLTYDPVKMLLNDTFVLSFDYFPDDTFAEVPGTVQTGAPSLCELHYFGSLSKRFILRSGGTNQVHCAENYSTRGCEDCDLTGKYGMVWLR